MFQVLFAFSISNGSSGFEALVENIYRKQQSGAKTPCGARQQIGENKLFSIVLCLLFLVQLNTVWTKQSINLFCHGNKSFVASEVGICLRMYEKLKKKTDLYFLNLNFLPSHPHTQLCADVNIISPHTLLRTPHGEGFASAWASQLRLCFKSVPGHLTAMPPRSTS